MKIAIKALEELLAQEELELHQMTEDGHESDCPEHDEGFINGIKYSIRKSRLEKHLKTSVILYVIIIGWQKYH